MPDTATELQPNRLVPKSGDVFDVIIIGAGPAGMSAALGAGRARLKTLIIDKALPGGQTTTACNIYNYLGFPGGILGADLAKKMEDHLFEYGIYHTCESVDTINDIYEKEKVVRTDLNNLYRTKGIIISVGLEPKKLNMPFERQFLGRGISYCAQCDAANYAGKVVAVIGGGNCACYAADYLSQFAKKIYMIHQKDHLRAVMTLKEKIFNNPIINLMWDSQVTEVFGIDKVEKIKVVNMLNDQYTWLDVNAIFIYAGRIPPVEILNLNLKRDEGGFIITDEYMRTNIPGVYAAGDVRSKQIRQIPTAVSDGMIAAINVERDLTR